MSHGLLHVNEKEGDRFVDGVKGALAVIHQGRDTIEVWDEDATLFYGHLPAGTPAATINAAVLFFREGFKDGTDYGKREKAQQIRAALYLQT